MRKLKFGSKEFKKRLLSEALDMGRFTVCKDCGSPILEGYVCTFCGSVDPNGSLDYTDMLGDLAYDIIESIK